MLSHRPQNSHGTAATAATYPTFAPHDATTAVTVKTEEEADELSRIATTTPRTASHLSPFPTPPMTTEGCATNATLTSHQQTNSIDAILGSGLASGSSVSTVPTFLGPRPVVGPLGRRGSEAIQSTHFEKQSKSKQTQGRSKSHSHSAMTPNQMARTLQKANEQLSAVTQAIAVISPRAATVAASSNLAQPPSYSIPVTTSRSLPGLSSVPASYSARPASTLNSAYAITSNSTHPMRVSTTSFMDATTQATSGSRTSSPKGSQGLSASPSKHAHTGSSVSPRNPLR